MWSEINNPDGHGPMENKIKTPPIRQQATSAFTEQDLTPMDLQVRELSFYSSNELHVLIGAVRSTIAAIREEGNNENAAIKPSLLILDAWCYRIRDAIKEANSREQELPY